MEKLVQSAVFALVKNDFKAARNSLLNLKSNFARLESERSAAIAKVRGATSSFKKLPRPATKSTRENVRVSDRINTFQRDGFICRYLHCQRRTIYVPVLKELSRIFPDLLPYHKNWRPVHSHILYWMWGTSLEHKISFPFGGTSRPENLITSCYQCNDLKNYLPYKVLGWQITEPASSDWHGLSQHLATLRQIADDLHAGGSVLSGAPFVNCSVLGLSSSKAGPGTGGAEMSMRVGNLVRVQLPGKRSRRPYRVDLIDGSRVTLTEMWRRDTDRAWVASRKSQTLLFSSLEHLSLVRSIAPLEGCIDS